MTLVAWPAELVVSMAVQQLGNDLVGGVSFGWLYRDAR